MRNYNMKNIQIEEATICSGTVKTVLIYADTERFGEHEIMAQLPNMKEALKWLEENGVDLHELAVEWLDEQIGAAGGRVQIGNTMYRRLYREKDNSIWGYSNSWGWRDISKFFEHAKVDGEGKAVTKGCADWAWIERQTIKLGNACTW